MKKIISLLLSATILVATFVPAFAADNKHITSNDRIKIVANGETSIEINKSIAEVTTQGLFDQNTYYIDVDRDYEQSGNISVTNNGFNTIEFYLACGSYSSDLAIDFIKGGSKNEPIILAPGESTDVELSIFTQNAKKERYSFEIFAYETTNGEVKPTSKATVSLSVNLMELNLSINKKSEDQYTLSQTYTVRNNSSYPITDLKISVDDSISKYIYLENSIEHAELLSSSTIDFTVVPNLKAMVDDKIEVLNGNINISGLGDEEVLEVAFDVTGKEIISTTMRELAFEQDGNMLVNMSIDAKNATYEIEQTDEDTAVLKANYTTIYGKQSEDSYTTELVTTLKSVDASTAETIVDNSYYEISDNHIHLYGAVLLSNSSQMRKVSLMSANEQKDQIVAIVDAVIKFAEGKNNEDIQKFINDFNNYNYDIEDSMSYKEIKDDSLYNKLSEDQRNALDARVHLASLFTMLFDVVDEHVTSKKVYPYVNEEGQTKYFSDDILLQFAILFNRNEKQCYNYISQVIDDAKKIMQTTIKLLNDLHKEDEKDIGGKDNDSPYKSGNERHDRDTTNRECTNVGKVTSSIYGANYIKTASSSLSNAQFEAYYTGRFHGGGYVNYEPINYKYYLNGEVIAEGSNNGLTELDVMQLPSNNFKLGEKNTFIREYDTNPGTHYVTKENEFTFIYPEDSVISYVGETSTLPDVRLKSDFACYDENIFAEDTAIIGKPNKIKVNYYNRGSQSGYYTINLYVNDELADSKNGFMKYFSINQLEFDWTPEQPNNILRVEIENKSRVVVERDDTNNIATAQVNARELEIPEIVSVAPNGDVEQGSDIIISAVVNKNADVKSVAFYLDDKQVTNETKSSGTNYWTAATTQELGNHKLSVTVTDTSDKTYTLDGTFNIIKAPNRYVGYDIIYNSIYATKDVEFNLEDYVYVLEPIAGEKNTYKELKLSEMGNDLVVEVSDTEDISVAETDRFKFTPKVVGQQVITVTLGVNTERVYIYTYAEPCKIATYNVEFEGNSYPNVTVYHKSNDEWNREYDYNTMYSNDYRTVQIIIAPNDFTAAEDYLVLLKDYKNNAAIVPFVEGTTTVSTKDNAQLSFKKNNDIECDYIRATLYLDDELMDTIYTNYDADINSVIKLPKQKYSLDVGFIYDEEYYDVHTDIDLTKENKEIDLVSLLNIATLKLNYSTPSDSPQIFVVDEYGNNMYVHSIKVDKTTYNVILENDMVENPQDYSLYVVDNNALYSTEVSADDMSVTSAESNKLSFKTDDKAIINRLQLKEIANDNIDISLDFDSSKPINLAKNTYKIAVQYVYNGVNLYSEYDIDLTESDTEIDLSADASETNFVVKWSSAYSDTGYLTLRDDRYNYFDSFTEYLNNTGRKLNAGNYDLDLYLYKGTLDFEINSEFEVTDESTVTEVNIGNEFSGILTNSGNRDSYIGNSSYSFRLGELKDSNNNVLEIVRTSYSSPLKGKVIFTNVNDETDVYEKEIEFSTLYSNNTYSVDLPNVTGKYNVSLVIDAVGINAPQANVESGEYNNSISVTLTSDNRYADIYYTLDGSIPTVNSTKYSKEFTISKSCILKAIAVFDDCISDVAEYEYTIKRASRSSGGSGVSRYTVTVSFIDENGKVVSTSKVSMKSGSTLTNSDLSVQTGYELSDSINYKITKNDSLQVKVKSVKNESISNEKKYVNGYEDNTFKPNNNITRAEIATLIFNILGENSASSTTSLNRFNDITERHWAKNAIAYNIENGYMNGDAAGNTFRPDDEMTRAELAQVLLNLDMELNSDANVNFNDIENHWAKNTIETIAKAGIVKGYDDNTFRPDNNVTRAEAVTMISRLFKRSNEWIGNISFSDVTPDFWAYETIMNAVTGND